MKKELRLRPADWAAFVATLNNPPAPSAALKAMLARVPVWANPAHKKVNAP